MSNIARRDGWGEIARHDPGRDNPFMLVPPEVVKPLSVLWLANFHLLPTSLPLCATVRVYTDEHNLTADAVAAICRKLMQPERRATHRFASDLIADFSAMVADAVRTRNAADEARERRETFAMPTDVKAGDMFQTP